MRITRQQLRLYFVMGSQNCEQSPEQTIKKAIKGGITCFQFREKGNGAKTGREKLDLALRLKKICQNHHIPFIVNDDVDLALEIEADGVHIGQEDEPAEYVRQKIGDKILGISAHNIGEARQAAMMGADYLGVGPMFPTKTKKDIRKVRGPKVIQEIRNAGITLPITGIGGINSENLEQVLRAGADGIAVISAISQSQNPEKKTLHISTQIKKFMLL
ncbi:MAG: thiamine phosphate synthase [Bacillaceae bacterium]|nr:thiamine phosphate synthase [Bacillaceae bacterium]